MNTLSLNDLYVLNWYLKAYKHHKGTMIEPVITYYDDAHTNIKKIRYKNEKGELHRDDGPARISYNKNGKKTVESYFKNGKLHRDGDRPAIIEYYENGNISEEEYYKNGELHRDGDKPARILRYEDGKIHEEHYYQNGVKEIVEYYKNGKIHEEHYYQNGELHRDSGPAIIAYYSNGVKEIVEYYKNGKLHRDGGPAKVIQYNNGMKKTEEYYQHGKLHRDGGSAYIAYYGNGNISEESYYKNGVLHRDGDKPAKIEYTVTGKLFQKEYYQNGKLHRNSDQGPARIYLYENGHILKVKYYQNGKLHRDNGPAIILRYKNGKKEQEAYYHHGKYHRDNDQPAVIKYDANGNITIKEYYKDGKEYFPRAKQTIAKPLTLEKTYKSAVGDARKKLKREYSQQKFDYTRKTTDWEELCHDNARSVDELRVLLKTHNKHIPGDKSTVCAELARNYTSEKDKQIKPICKNDQTAVMFEDLTSIPKNRIWTYTDENKVTWCFDLVNDVQWLQDNNINPWNKQRIPISQVRLFLAAAAQYKLSPQTTVSPFEQGGLHYKQDRIVMSRAENVDVIALELENFLTDYFINEKLEYSSVAHVIKAFHDKKLGKILYKVKIQYPTLDSYNFNYDEKLPDQDKARLVKELLTKIAEIPDVTKKVVYYQIQEFSKKIYDI